MKLPIVFNYLIWCGVLSLSNANIFSNAVLDKDVVIEDEKDNFQTEEMEFMVRNLGMSVPDVSEDDDTMDGDDNVDGDDEESDNIERNPPLFEGRILAPGERLPQGQAVSSVNGRCKIQLQADGNLVVKKDGKNAWSSGSHSAHTSEGPFFLKLNKGGALMVRSESGEGIFCTNTRNTRLDVEQGGLFFNQDCTITIKANDDKDDVWTNVRSVFYNGNRLDRGDMFRYPPNNPKYVLLLQNDGNLIMFEGADLSDYSGPQDILWGAGVTSSSDRFFLKFTCDGRLVLKQKVGDEFVPYWTRSIVSKEDLSEVQGYSLVLQEDNITPFGYDPIEANCRDGSYSH